MLAERKNFTLSIIINLMLENRIRGLHDNHIEDIHLDYMQDVDAFLDKDPATHGDFDYLIAAYTSHHAVAGYRLSNFLWQQHRFIDAHTLQEFIKIRTGIEIHPGARIGKRFVIDHGVGTVIGETCEIGDDCYILQNVILGSSRIVGCNGKRHPSVGCCVEIGGFSRLFGPIHIGDNVKISPYSVITTDIPSNSSVVIKNTYQEVRRLPGC